MQTIRFSVRPALTLAPALWLVVGVPTDLLAQREARDDEYAVNDPRVSSIDRT